MEKTDYIQLFDKFLLKQASAEEIQVLIQWLKSEGSFLDWADEEWNVAASEMDTKLQRQLFGQIKEKISQIDKTCLPEKENRRRKFYLWFARVASVILLLLMTGLSVHYYTMSQMIMPDMIVSVEKRQMLYSLTDRKFGLIQIPGCLMVADSIKKREFCLWKGRPILK